MSSIISSTAAESSLFAALRNAPAPLASVAPELHPSAPNAVTPEANAVTPEAAAGGQSWPAGQSPASSSVAGRRAPRPGAPRLGARHSWVDG